MGMTKNGLNKAATWAMGREATPAGQITPLPTAA